MGIFINIPAKYLQLFVSVPNLQIAYIFLFPITINLRDEFAIIQAQFHFFSYSINSVPNQFFQHFVKDKIPALKFNQFLWGCSIIWQAKPKYLFIIFLRRIKVYNIIIPHFKFDIFINY